MFVIIIIYTTLIPNRAFNHPTNVFLSLLKLLSDFSDFKVYLGD